VFGIISWAVGQPWQQLPPDHHGLHLQPLASMGGVVGWAYVIFNSLLWFFGVHGSLALTALDNGIMTPWALENIALYNQYGSVEAAIAAGKSSTSGPSRCWTPTSCWGSGARSV
jgi:PTS system cellobiose-specific IIC component